MFHTLKLLLPAMIPSWNFFDVIAASPRVEYALLQSCDETERKWREFLPRPNHLSVGAMAARLFWNAQWNEALFVLSCAERLMDGGADHIQEEIFRRIAVNSIKEDTSGTWLSFRIILLSEQEGSIERKVCFVSDPRRVAITPCR